METMEGLNSLPCRHKSSVTLQGVLSKHVPPLARVQLVASSALLRLRLDHVAPGSPESLGQGWTGSRETQDVHRRPETADWAEVFRQDRWRKDLEKDPTEVRRLELLSSPLEKKLKGQFTKNDLFLIHIIILNFHRWKDSHSISDSHHFLFSVFLSKSETLQDFTKV